jgi:hypothetical protein
MKAWIVGGVIFVRTCVVAEKENPKVTVSHVFVQMGQITSDKS